MKLQVKIYSFIFILSYNILFFKGNKLHNFELRFIILIKIGY